MGFYQPKKDCRIWQSFFYDYKIQGYLAAASTAISVCADTAAVATAAENKDEPDQIIIATSAVIAIIAA